MNKKIFLNLDCYNREGLNVSEGDSLTLTILPLLNRIPLNLEGHSIKAIYASDTGYFWEQTDNISNSGNNIVIKIPDVVLSNKCILKFCLELIKEGGKITSFPLNIIVRGDIRKGKVPFL